MEKGSGCLLSIVAAAMVFMVLYLGHEKHAKFERAAMNLIRQTQSDIQAVRRAAEAGAEPDDLARRLRAIEHEIGATLD